MALPALPSPCRRELRRRGAEQGENGDQVFMGSFHALGASYCLTIILSWRCFDSWDGCRRTASRPVRLRVAGVVAVEGTRAVIRCSVRCGWRRRHRPRTRVCANRDSQRGDREQEHRQARKNRARADASEASPRPGRIEPGCLFQPARTASIQREHEHQAMRLTMWRCLNAPAHASTPRSVPGSNCLSRCRRRRCACSLPSPVK